MTPAKQAGPGVWRVALVTLREAPQRMRRVAMMICGNWLLLVLLQLIVDSDTASAAYEVLELTGVVLGSAGGLLLLLIYMLHATAQEAAAQAQPAAGGGIVFTRMLVALPVFAAASVVPLSAGLMTYVARALITPTPGDAVFHLAIALLLAAAIVFAMLLIRRSVVFLHMHAAEQSEVAARATEHAARAELQALQAQMNPHFLFNALNTVASLVRTSPQNAERTVEHLADVLRRTLDRSRSPHGTVREEIDYLRSYLAIEQERWGERLRVEWDVAEQALVRALPPMSLQPLVENALKHGLSARRAGGTIRIAVHVEADDALVLTVRDDGEGFAPRVREGTGIGNLRRRLKTLFGENARVDIASGDDGTSVTLHVPARNTHELVG